MAELLALYDAEQRRGVEYFDTRREAPYSGLNLRRSHCGSRPHDDQRLSTRDFFERLLPHRAQRPAY